MRMANELPFSLYITEGVPADRSGSHVENSEHFEGLGVDLRAQNGWERISIVKAALYAGIDRIGVYTGHIHLGASKTLPHPVMWSGVSK